jgi:peptidoglycan hydrolase-like protein with peptidoglycan-binding domain
MNKLGFYTQNFAQVAGWIQRIKPPVLMAEMGDRGALRNTRNIWSPETFIMGRFYYKREDQETMINDPDPEKVGRQLAERCIKEDSYFGLQRGASGRLIVDAWMSLNEVLPGPASQEWQNPQERAKYIQRAERYDTLQVAFRERLRQEGLEAVAFNFGAGNWTRGEDYLQYFPKTLAAYTYLGFHEYGWPCMDPNEAETNSACGDYRSVMQAIRQAHGSKHKVIITETGLARMHKYIETPPGDVGWLYVNQKTHAQEVTEDNYKASLRWYNQFLAKDDYVLGACLYMVGGGSADWETFEHVGVVHGQTLTLMAELEALAQAPAPIGPEPPLAPVVEGRRLRLQDPLLEGDDVRAVQERLIDLKYLTPQDIKGVFNETTHLAVREFQTANCLIIDGVVGPQTWQALFSPMAVARQRPPAFGYLKVGLDLNSPLNGATGTSWGPVTQPAVLAASGAHWTRLNFILGPEHTPNDTWFGTYRQIIQQINDAWGGVKPHIYSLVGVEAAHRDPRNLLRFPPVEVNWAWRGYSLEDRQKSVPFVDNLVAQMGERPEQWIEGYAEHFRLIVEAFHDRIHYFEAFNEPNDWHLNAPAEDQIDPLRGGNKWEREWVHPYWAAVILEQIHQRIKAYQDVKLIACPLLGFAMNWDITEKYLRDIYEAGRRLFGWSNGRYPFYGVGYHLYVHPGFNPAEADPTAYIQMTYREHLNRIHQVIINQEGPDSNKKIYISEFSWPSPNPDSETDQAIQAYALQTAFDLLKDDPRVDMAIWFCTADFGGEPLGLYRNQPLGPATQKKALETFRAVAGGPFPP